jgi:hypothetical protein
MDKNKHSEHSLAYGNMKGIINGNEIRHLQFSEFSEGHGSIYGTLNNGKKFKLHITELFKMIDEFEFSVYRGSGDVLDHTLKVNWGATNELRREKDFTFKSSSIEYRRDGNTPTKVNYVAKVDKGKDTKFIEYRTGPYYSGNLIITNPEDVKEL